MGDVHRRRGGVVHGLVQRELFGSPARGLVHTTSVPGVVLERYRWERGGRCRSISQNGHRSEARVSMSGAHEAHRCTWSTVHHLPPWSPMCLCLPPPSKNYPHTPPVVWSRLEVQYKSDAQQSGASVCGKGVQRVLLAETRASAEETRSRTCSPSGCVHNLFARGRRPGMTTTLLSTASTAHVEQLQCKLVRYRASGQLNHHAPPNLHLFLSLPCWGVGRSPLSRPPFTACLQSLYLSSAPPSTTCTGWWEREREISIPFVGDMRLWYPCSTPLGGCAPESG
jgi:hypothetical protein